jgi:hypothetical protein
VHKRKHLGAQFVEQEMRADIRVVRFLLDECARCHDGRQHEFVLADSVVEIAVGFGENGARIGTVETCASLGYDQSKASVVERHPRPVGECDLQRGLRKLRCLGPICLGAPFRSFLAVKHVGAGNLVVFAAHQREFDLILHVFDMEGPSFADPSRQRADDFRGECLDRFVHAAGAGGGVPFHGEEGFCHRHRNFAGVERRHRAVATNDLHPRLARRGGRCWARLDEGSGFGGFAIERQ